MSKLDYLNRTICDAFWCDGTPLRNLLIELMEKHKINDKNHIYKEMYNNLKNDEYFIKDKQDKCIQNITRLIHYLSVDGHINILQEMANSKCRVPNRSLLEEVTAYYEKEIDYIQQQINIILRMLSNSSDYSQTIYSQLLKEKNKLIDELDRKKKEKYERIDICSLQKKIKIIKNGDHWQEMKRKNLDLSTMEILSIILYCNYDIFANKLRESHRKQHLNSCEWRTLFHHLHCAIVKIHKAKHYKNNTFYRDYVRNRRRNGRHRLYHGLFNVKLQDENQENIPLQTISSFSEEFEIAKQFSCNKGLIFAVNNAFESIYKGDVIAADVSWISDHQEWEWIVLPVMLTSTSKVKDDDQQFDEHFRDKELVKIYTANFQQNPQNLKVSKCFKKMTMMLYKYKERTRIRKNENIISDYIKNQEQGWEELIRITTYIQSVDYHKNIGEDDALYKDCMDYMHNFGISKQNAKFIWDHIGKFFNEVEEMINKDTKGLNEQMIEIRMLECKCNERDKQLNELQMKINQFEDDKKLWENHHKQMSLQVETLSNGLKDAGNLLSSMLEEIKNYDNDTFLKYKEIFDKKLRDQFHQTADVDLKNEHFGRFKISNYFHDRGRYFYYGKSRPAVKERIYTNYFERRFLSFPICEARYIT